MQRLRLLPKFILVCVTCLIPAGLVTALLLGELQKAVRQAEGERTGLACVMAVEQLASELQQHRGLERLRLATRASTSHDGMRRNLAARAQSLGCVDAILTAQGGAPVWHGQRKALQDLLDKAASLTQRDSLRAHDTLLAGLARVQASLLEASHLAVDPELPTQRLIHLAGTTLPQLSQHVLDLGARGAPYIDTGLFEGDEERLIDRSQMAAGVLAEQARQHYTDLLAKLPALQGPLSQHQAAVQGVSAFLERTRNEVNQSVQQTSGRAFWAGAAASARQLQALAQATAAEADRMLAARASQAILKRNLAMAASLLALLLAAWLFAGFYVSFNRDVRHLRNAVERAARGELDLSLHSDARDEIGELVNAFQAMCGDLVELVGRIRSGTRGLNQATGSLVAGNRELSSHTHEQADALAHTVAAMRNMASTLADSAVQAEQGRALMASASAVARRGGERVADVVRTMDDIKEGSRQIADIVGLIDELAFQTNILALNAAVEAARAGAQGRGFAVVAGEVRALAQRSGAASADIRKIIQRSVQAVEQGHGQVEAAGRTISELVQAVAKAEQLIAAMAEAGQDQAGDMDSLNEAIGRIDAMVRQNGQLVQAARVGSSRLKEETELLASAVSVFRTETKALPALACH
jgi:methyl-accepting chemotaxis protein